MNEQSAQELGAQELGAQGLDAWMSGYTRAVGAAFGERVVFVGIQGSRARGEATPQSDIDAVLILDTLSMQDLSRYRKAVAPLPHRELLCGFVSGVGELKGWAPAELFQFYHDTVPIVGSLDFLAPRAGRCAATQAVQTGACAIYHAAAHNFVHERSGKTLQELFKSAVFVLQAKCFLEQDRYVARRAALQELLSGDDLAVLQAGLALKERAQPPSQSELDGLTGILLRWAGALIEGASGDAKRPVADREKR